MDGVTEKTCYRFFIPTVIMARDQREYKVAKGRIYPNEKAS